MIAEGSPMRLVIVNVLAWWVLHWGVAWLGTQLPLRLFRPDQGIFRPRKWERKGRIYERGFQVRRWKDRLPDGAAFFSRGYPKAKLGAVTPERVGRLMAETCRGEAVHGVVLMAAFLFFAWNPWLAGCVNLAYGLAANLPCIIVQRYNRLRLARLPCKG